MDNSVKTNGLQAVKIKVSYPLTTDIVGRLISCFGRLSCVLQGVYYTISRGSSVLYPLGANSQRPLQL